MRRLTGVGLYSFLLLLLSGALTSAAKADCDETGHGAPGVSNIAATTTSITVSWFLLCPVIPNSMQLRQGGTSQMQYQDGTLLGQQVLQPLENGGGVTANNLAPATTYQNLHLCAIYSGPGEPPWCTPSFGAATLNPSLTPTPTITQVSATQNSITFAWNGNTNYAGYNVSIIQAAYAMIGAPTQYSVGGGQTGQYTFSPLNSATTYQIAVQGCIPGGWVSDCSSWTGKDVTTKSPPPPAALPPQNLHSFSNSISWIEVLWTNPPGVLSVETMRTPGYSPSSSIQSIPGGIQDNSVVSGQEYTYQVCLTYQAGVACGTVTGRSQSPPPAPSGCVGSSLTYGTVEVMCYTYASGGIVSYDATDPMVLQRLNPNGGWIVADDGVSNPWDVPPPRESVPFFQDSSFQTEPNPPTTATYRVVASNQWANSASAPFTVNIDLTVQPVTVPGPPPCGPLSKPYRRCMAIALGPNSLHQIEP